jgi:sugar phosphate isomerase/epimerase
MIMKIGICTSLDHSAKAKIAGFDYVEVAAAGFADRPGFDPKPYQTAEIRVTNVFFPGSLNLSRDGRGPLLDYAQTALARAAEIGIELMVIGSGATRKAIDGRDPGEYFAKFIDLVAEIQALALPLGIQVAPESLKREETNVGNDLRSLALALDAVGVGYTADSHHVLAKWFSDGGIGVPPYSLWEDQIPHVPQHVHLGDLARVSPWPDDTALRGFVRRLRDLGYAGRVSVEAGLKDDSLETLSLVRGQVAELFGSDI